MQLLVGGSKWAWNVFLARKEWKKLNFLRFWDAYMSLSWCSNTVRTWRKVASASLFLFIVLIDIVASVIGMRFFHLCFRLWIEVLLYCSVTKAFAIGIKTCFDHDWFNFGVSCRNMPRFVNFIYAWADVCMSCSMLILFWRHQIFLTVSLRVFLVCT